MANTSLKIIAKDQNDKTLNTTVTYINPELPVEDMLTLARTLNDLTTNQYASSQRIETVDLDTAESIKARNVVVAYVDYSEGSKSVTITDLTTVDVPLNQLQNSSGTRRLVFNISNSPGLRDDTSRLIVTNVTTTVGSVTCGSASNYFGSNNWQLSCILSEASAQTITITFSLAANSIYEGWSHTYIFNIIEGGE